MGRRISAGGHGSNSITLLRPKVKGFKPSQQVDSIELQPVVPQSSKQSFMFNKFSTEGVPISEVFCRFESKTPWKKVGELANTNGDFAEAVRSQWPLLVERAYYLSRKVRFYMPSEHPIKFGYADEKAEIVTVEDGILGEATDPLQLKDMLSRSGFLGELKPRWWRHMHMNAKDMHETKKDMLVKSPHLMHRARNNLLSSFSRYNPHKYRGTVADYQTKKDGLVVGAKHPKTR